MDEGLVEVEDEGAAALRLAGTSRREQLAAAVGGARHRQRELDEQQRLVIMLDRHLPPTIEAELASLIRRKHLFAVRIRRLVHSLIGALDARSNGRFLGGGAAESFSRRLHILNPWLAWT